MRFFSIFLRYILLVFLCLLVVPFCAGSDVLCLSGENHPRVRQPYESFSNRAAADAAQARAYLSPAVFLGTLKSVLVQRDGTVRAWFAVDNFLKMPNDTMRSPRISRMVNNYSRLAYRSHYVPVPAVRPRDFYEKLYPRTPAPRIASSKHLPIYTRVYQRVENGNADWTVSRHPPLISAFKRSTRTTLNRKLEDTEVVYYKNGKCVLEVNQDNLKLGSQYVVFGSPARRHSWPSLTASALPIANDKRILRAVKKVLCKGCAKPPGIEGLQNVVVEEGSRARLQCHLAGNPIPWVEWFKDGKKVIRRGRVRVKTKRRTSRLLIRRSRLSDRGVYECRAGNVVSSEEVFARASLLITKRGKRRKTTVAPTTTSTTQSSPWTTEPCPVTDFCNNGGTCVFYRDVQEYVCHCADGFIGLTCDYKDVRVSVEGVKNYSPRNAIP